MLPPLTAKTNDEPKSYEQHGVTNPNDCYAMADRFKREGRKVKLVDVIANDFNKGGGVLEFLCLFDGEDAQIEDGSAFEDYRYNSPNEYAYP